MSLNWYPGHMAKTKNELKNILPSIDYIIEILDARAPLATRNPDLDTLATSKNRIVLLAKSDLADPAATSAWEDFFLKRFKYSVFVLNLTASSDIKKLKKFLITTCLPKEKKGWVKPARGLVCGIPNVGKSTLINRLIKSASLKVENRPGVTRSNQWVMISKSLELCDTPGILWPKFESEDIAFKVALLGSIKETLIPYSKVSRFLHNILVNRYQKKLNKRFSITENTNDFESFFNVAASNRGCFKKNKQLDDDRFYKLFLLEFKTGKLGRITLETPSESL